MVSQADTLKIAEADMVTARGKISNARMGRTFGAPDPRDEVRDAVFMLGRTARRLRKSFRLEGE